MGYYRGFLFIIMVYYHRVICYDPLSSPPSPHSHFTAEHLLYPIKTGGFGSFATTPYPHPPNTPPPPTLLRENYFIYPIKTGGFGSFATTPMDVVKTRMMTSTQSSTVLEAVMRIAKVELP